VPVPPILVPGPLKFTVPVLPEESTIVDPVTAQIQCETSPIERSAGIRVVLPVMTILAAAVALTLVPAPGVQ
ncbi:hypothetical protein, partial [Chitinophaga pinensis]|uniref:hypothetical protein n=1 Tax=Chitinophaga pinensis TaxID=79329 RepID=UPI001C9940E1